MLANSGTLARWSRYAFLPAMGGDITSVPGPCRRIRASIRAPITRRVDSRTRNEHEKSRPYVCRVDVALVRWPEESDRRRRLERDGLPRLLLVEDGAAPPLVEDPLEDWVRVPATEL